MYLAWALLDSGNLGRALQEVQAAIERDPSLGDAYWIRGVVRLRTGAVQDALNDLTRATQLRPARFEAFAAIGECYDQLRRLPDAMRAYQRALEGNGQNGEWWYKLGRLQMDSDARRDAEQSLARAVLLGEAMPNRPGWLADAHRIYGDALRLGGNRPVAIEHYRRYLEIAPPSAIDRPDVRRALLDLGVALPPQ